MGAAVDSCQTTDLVLERLVRGLMRSVARSVREADHVVVCVFELIEPIQPTLVERRLVQEEGTTLAPAQIEPRRLQVDELEAFILSRSFEGLLVAELRARRKTRRVVASEGLDLLRFRKTAVALDEPQHGLDLRLLEWSREPVTFDPSAEPTGEVHDVEADRTGRVGGVQEDLDVSCSPEWRQLLLEGSQQVTQRAAALVSAETHETRLL